MPYYKSMGKIPRKRHTVFKKENGSLFREQVMGTKGFSGLQSILYHHNPPTQ
ncbi:MAG: homogentisate 1,2-dioxygenase, partial [Mesobacillus sp.]